MHKPADATARMPLSRSPAPAPRRSARSVGARAHQRLNAEVSLMARIVASGSLGAFTLASHGGGDDGLTLGPRSRRSCLAWDSATRAFDHAPQPFETLLSGVR